MPNVLKGIYKKVPSITILNRRKLTSNFFSLSPQGFFLVFATLFGFLFVFLTPPLQTPDENSHFLRAYQVSDLNIVSDPISRDGAARYGSQIPTSVIKAMAELKGDISGKPQNEFKPGLYKQFLTQPLEQEKTEATVIEAAAVYSPVVYLPQAVGIGIGKLFDASPLIIMWLGRLMNLMVWILAIYTALKILPFGKWGLAILALNPVAVFISASMSPDVINISLGFLFVSLLCSTFMSKEKHLSKKTVIFMLTLLAVLSLSKPVNLLFSLLLFALPLRYFKTKITYILFCLSGILLSAFLFIIWNYQVRDILDAAVLSQSGGLHISVKDQLAYIIDTPVGYAWDIIRNYIIVSPSTYGDAVLATYFGVLGWLDTTIPLWTIILYVLTLFLGVLYQFGRGIRLKVWQKGIFLTVFILAFVGNITAMYFNATTVGSHTIGGVQGRYFIPFSIILLSLFTARKKILNIEERSFAIMLACMMLIVLGMTTLKIFLRYY